MKHSIAFWVSTIAIAIFAIFIISYAVFRSRDLYNGPQITISEPADGAVLTESLVTIKGIITNATAVTLNDRKIFLDQAGNFNEKLLLSSGYTIITLKAEDRYKRATEKKLGLTVEK